MEFILSPSDNLPAEYLSVAQEIADNTLKDALSDPGNMCLMVQFHCGLHQEDPSFLFDIQQDENDTSFRDQTGNRLQQAVTPHMIKPLPTCLLSCQSMDSRSVKKNTRNLQSTSAAQY